MNDPIDLFAGIERVKALIALAIEADGNKMAGFDLDRWILEWVERPQPALGGARPVELLHTREGAESVCIALGAVVSGAYQ